MKTKNNKSIKQDHAAANPEGQSIREACIDIADSDEPLLFIEGHDDAILGVAEREDYWLVVYDSQKIVRRLQERDGMSLNGAKEYFEFNMAGAWLGNNTPIFVRPT